MTAWGVALQERPVRTQVAQAGGRVLVTGATGFVGSRLVRKLLRLRIPVRAMVRSSRSAESLHGVECEVVTGDVRDIPSLHAAFTECAAVVHLVAVLREKAGATFETINHIGTANVVAAAQRQGVARIVHMSALGAGPHATRYLRSKWAGEEEVRRGVVPYAIFRPSLILGPNGGAAAQFADVVRLGIWYPLRRLMRPKAFWSRLADLLPVVPILGSGQARFMPVHIDDLLEAVSQAVHRTDVLGDTYEVGGSDIVTYEEMLRAVADRLRVRRWMVHVPLAAAWVLVRLFALLPDPPITADELAALLRDNICDNTKVHRLFQLVLRPFRIAIADALGRPFAVAGGAHGGETQ